MTNAMLAISDTQLATNVLFYTLAAGVALSALAVVLSRNIVRTALFLLFTLGGVAGLYFLLNAEFLAAVQLVVYAGGTLILIIFGVMLTSKAPGMKFEPKAIEVLVAAITGTIMLVALLAGIISTRGYAGHPAEIVRQPLDWGTSQYPVSDLGQALLGDYLLPFELASVLLLVVMIGAAFLAKGRRRRSGREDKV